MSNFTETHEALLKRADIEDEYEAAIRPSSAEPPPNTGGPIDFSRTDIYFDDTTIFFSEM